MRSNHMGIKLKKVEIVKKKFNSKNYLEQNKQQIKEWEPNLIDKNLKGDEIKKKQINIEG